MPSQSSVCTGAGGWGHTWPLVGELHVFIAGSAGVGGHTCLFHLGSHRAGWGGVSSVPPPTPRAVCRVVGQPVSDTGFLESASSILQHPPGTFLLWSYGWGA